MRSNEEHAHPHWHAGPPWAVGPRPAMAGAYGGGEEGDRGWRGGRFGGGPGFGGGGFPFGGPPGWGGRGRGWGRGGRARRGDVRAAVLLLLSEAPRNGYQVIQELAERSRGTWRPSPGSVYPVLQQLEDEGLVVTTSGDAGRTYRLTDAGSAYVASHRAEMGVPWEEAANAVGQPTIDFAQLMHQVVGAMKQVIHAGNEQQLAQASAVLTDTRRALYRILAEDAPARDAPPGVDETDEGADA